MIPESNWKLKIIINNEIEPESLRQREGRPGISRKLLPQGLHVFVFVDSSALTSWNNCYTAYSSLINSILIILLHWKNEFELILKMDLLFSTKKNTDHWRTKEKRKNPRHPFFNCREPCWDTPVAAPHISILGFESFFKKK